MNYHLGVPEERISSGPLPVTSGGWIRRMFPFILKDRLSLVLTFAAAVIGMLATAASPTLMGTIVDESILSQRRPLAPLLAILVGLGAVRFGIGFVRRYFGSRVAAAVDYDLRNAIYDHLHRLDFTRHDEMQTGQLVSRANTDVQIVERLLGFLPILSSNVLLFPISIGFMINISPPLTLIAAIIVPVFLWLTMHMRKVVYPSSWDASQRAAEVTGVAEEAITGVRIVKAFGQERRELNRLIEAATGLFGARMRNIRLSAKRQATMMTVPLMGQIAVLALGGLIAIQGELSVGKFLAFLTYLAQLIAPIGMMAWVLVMAQTARASAERILEVLDSTPEITEREDAQVISEIKGSIEFNDVTFGYLRSEPVLSEFNFSVSPGETIALVGASGSGKSTVAALLPRFYDPQAGSVTIDGHNVADLTLASLRRHIGVVFEDSFLFSESVKDNIAYGRPDATQEEIEAAARAAEAHEFILELPEGYETVVGERGLSLSGGQRQRIALARALITDPRILLLDDATSSIDVKVEEQIHNTLRRLMKGRTTILIAHRRSTLELANRIVVVAEGRVVDQGTHDELFDRCHHYHNLLSGPSEDIDAETAEDASEVPAATGVTPRPAEPIAGRVGRAGMGRGIRLAGAMNMPPEELQAAIDKLPPIRDVPDVDVALETKDDPGFSLWRFVRPYRRVLAFGLLLVALNALAMLAGPYIVRQGIDHGVVGKNLEALLVAVGLFIVSALFSRTLNWFSSVYTGRTGQRLLFAMRVRVFAQLQRLGLDFYDREMGGRILTRMTSDIEALHSLLQTGLIQSLVQIVTFFGTVAVLFHMNSKLALYVLLVAPPLIAASLLYRAKSGAAYLRVREGVAAVNANFQESISGIRVAQAFSRETTNMDSYRQVTGEYFDARLDSQRISSLYFPFIELMSVVANVIVLGVGAKYLAEGSLTPGQLIAFSLYINTVFSPLQQLSSLFDAYQRAKAAMTKLKELLATETSIPEADEPVSPSRLKGEVRFERVRFRYLAGAKEALRGVTFDIPAGQTLALVGETGAGKSTIVKLLARFYDPTEGSIHIDGIPLKNLALDEYRFQIGFVPQEPFLFSGTIRENITYGKPASLEEMQAASVAVGADEFIRRLPMTYDEPVTERGRSLSSGQRQLIALARALLVDPAILLLDEATANLDLATEARVNRAMGVVSRGRTTLLIAHRLTTAHRADRILVIDDGGVVEDGSPQELIEADGHYAELWRTYNAEADRIPA